MMSQPKQNSNYFCDICDSRSPNESSYRCHLLGKRHKANAERLQSIKNEAARSVFVANCMHLAVAELSLADYFSKFGVIAKITVDKNRGAFAIVQFHDEISASNALSTEEHQLMGIKLVVKPREAKLPTVKKTECEKHHIVHKQMQSRIWNMILDADDVDAQFKTIQQDMSLNDNEKHIRNLLCQLLTAALEEVFDSCEIRAFGSSVNGIGFHGCDVDLNLSFSSVDYKYAMQLLSKGSKTDEGNCPVKLDSKEILQVAASIIQNFVPDCHQVKAILTARRPVVKFRHKASGISCDLSVGNELAIRNTDFLHHLCGTVPYFTPLVQAIKLWMKHWNLAGSTKAASPLLNNYAVSMMIVFYLNQTNELHTLIEMRAKDEMLQPIMVENWDCSFSKLDPQIKEATRSLPEIFAEFFKFYAKFDFSNKVICVDSGKPQDIKVFTSSNDADATAGFKLGPLNIQDPFELNHNIAGNVGQKHMIIFSKCLRNAALACDMKIFSKNPGDASKGPWGVLCLFVDHHKKGGSPKQESCKSLSDEIEITVSGTSDHEVTRVVTLIITILTDVFMIEVFPARSNERCIAQVNHKSISCPLYADVTSGEMSTQMPGHDKTSRKRHLDDETPASKRVKLSLNSPEAEELKKKANLRCINEGKVTQFPLELKCQVMYKVWEGRRKIRRQLVNPAVKDIMDLEKQISKLLITESQCHDGSFESSHSSNDISTSFFIDVCICRNGANLMLKVTYDKQQNSTNSCNAEQDFRNMVHHMKLSLTSMIKKCMKT